ncbi:MAG: hypothetical protein ABR503_01860, partial [Chitinophagaceae bacterium]
AKISLLFFLAGSMFFYGCKKDKDAPAQQTCKVIKVNYFGTNGAPVDSAAYTYTGDKVSKVQLSKANYTLEYSGNNIVKRNIFSTAGATPDAYDQVTYNSDGTISKIEGFERVSSNYVLVFRASFTYTGGKVTKASFSDINNNTATVYEDYVYSYTGNNVTSSLYTDYSGSTPSTQTFTFTYDTNPNYFKKYNSQFLLIDAFFADFDGLFLPVAFSENNVTNISSGGQSIPFTYTLDSRQNLGD